MTPKPGAEESDAMLAARYRLFTELASDYVYDAVVPADGSGAGHPTIVAGSFERTTGLTPAEVEARGGWIMCVHPDDRSRVVALFKDLAVSERPLVLEYRIIDAAGHTRWLRDRTSALRDESGRLVRCIGGVTEITEHKELLAQLVQAHKLESLARLAGGVAHDFNNLLTIIAGEHELLELGETDRSDVRAEGHRAIRDAIERAAALTRSLLAFGRRTAAEVRTVDLGQVVEAALPMLTRALGERVRLSLEVEEGADLRVAIDPGELQLVLLNLGLNARDAMPGAGLLALRLAEIDVVAGDEARPPELAAGRYALLVVKDDGVGMSDEVRERVFEPYFTTKAVGHGSGLGLATAHGIIARAGGAIGVTSRPGAGTTFSIHLPLTSAPTSSVTTTAASAVIGGHERILLVDDEPMLRRVAARALRQVGYEVVEAGSTEEALALAPEVIAGVKLLVADCRLPGADGITLADALVASSPALAVLVISGHLEDQASARLATRGYGFMAKPFSPGGLIVRCREALASRANVGTDLPAP